MTMPEFTLKAQDLLTLPTIQHYWALCKSYGLHEQAAEVELAMQEMVRWIEDNPGQLKVPDHKHVPTDKEVDWNQAKITVTDQGLPEGFVAVDGWTEVMAVDWGPHVYGYGKIEHVDRSGDCD